MSNSELTLTINGAQVTVPQGSTIFEAAQAAGINIPHLCYDPCLGLPPTSSCRLCVVEVEGARAPAASCSHPAANGMVVRTETETLRNLRRMVIELLLSDHPHECVTCDMSGACALEDYAYEFGVRKRRAAKPVSSQPAPDAPMLLYDRSKCILCGRCVAVCQDVQAAGAIDFMGRGFVTEISLPPGLTRENSDCELCGNCVAVCPTGAASGSRMTGLVAAKKVRTTCAYCGVGCQFDLNVKDGRVVGVTSAPDAPVNGRWLCVKGRFGYEFMSHPDRLTTPLIRRDGQLQPAAWDEAMDYTARRLAETKAAHGPDAVAFISSSRCTNEENYLVQKIARAAIGTNNVDQCART